MHSKSLARLTVSLPLRLDQGPCLRLQAVSLLEEQCLLLKCRKETQKLALVV
jgi:hypothetical protein